MKLNIIDSQPVDDLLIVQFETEPRDSFAYKTSTDALAQHIIQVCEVSDQGSVNNLLVDNPSEHFVFFMDGDILAGAKQNRVLNVSILLKPRSKTVVPVSCVERGRWRSVSVAFAATDHSAPASIRASKSRHFARRGRPSGDFMADQASVWDQVQSKMSQASFCAPTENLSDLFEQKKADFDNALRNMRPAPNANGLAIFCGAKLVCLDVFNRADALADYLPRIVRGVLLDAIGRPRPGVKTAPDQAAAAAQTILASCLEQQGNTQPSISAGAERRFETPDLVGFELAYDQHLIHLSVLDKTGLAQ